MMRIQTEMKKGISLLLVAVSVPTAVALCVVLLVMGKFYAEQRTAQTAVTESEFRACLDLVPESEAGSPIPSVTETKKLSADRIGGVIYFCTKEEPYCDAEYGTDSLKEYSCGPTTMAMAISTLSDIYIDPIDMCQWSVDNLFWLKGGGTYTAFMTEAPKAFNVPCRIRYWSYDVIREEIANGKLIIFTVGPGAFTNGSHFMMIRGIAENGGLLLCDSYSREFSQKVWPYDEITAQLLNSTIWVLG